jgi:hypothetical protein
MLDDEGDEITPESVVTGEGERVRVALPTAATGDRDRVIVRVTALRGGRPAPRALELHVALAGGAPRVIALRH